MDLAMQGDALAVVGARRFVHWVSGAALKLAPHKLLATTPFLYCDVHNTASCFLLLKRMKHVLN